MDNFQWLAIRAFCQACTIPVIAENEKSAAVVGTGVLFEINNRKYFITACHVAENILNPSIKCGIPNAKQHAGVFSFDGCEAYLPKDEHEKTLYDVGLIELSSNEMLCKQLAENYQFLSLENVGRYHNTPANYLLAGYPSKMSVNISDYNIYGRFFLLCTPPYCGEIDTDKIPDPENNVFLDYGKTIIDEKGNEIAAPELEGISGGTIWNLDMEIDDKSLWIPKDNIELIAVEVSYLTPSYKYIRGVKWNVVAHMFGDADPLAKNCIIDKLAAI